MTSEFVNGRMVILRARFVQKHGLVFHCIAYLKKHFANLLCHVHNTYHSEMLWCLKEFCFFKGIPPLETVQNSREGICVYKNSALPNQKVAPTTVHLKANSYHTIGFAHHKICARKIYLKNPFKKGELLSRDERDKEHHSLQKKALAKCLADANIGLTPRVCWVITIIQTSNSNIFSILAGSVPLITCGDGRVSLSAWWPRHLSRQGLFAGGGGGGAGRHGGTRECHHTAHLPRAITDMTCSCRPDPGPRDVRPLLGLGG